MVIGESPLDREPRSRAALQRRDGQAAALQSAECRPACIFSPPRPAPSSRRARRSISASAPARWSSPPPPTANWRCWPPPPTGQARPNCASPTLCASATISRSISGSKRPSRHARLVVLRLLGGAAYWPYGVDELTALGADRRHPPRPAARRRQPRPHPAAIARPSTPDDWDRLHALFIAGGPDNADAICWRLPRCSQSGLSPSRRGRRRRRRRMGPRIAASPEPFPRFGLWYPATGIVGPALRPLRTELARGQDATAAPNVPILFYRAALEGAGTATLEALIAELEAQGLAPGPDPGLLPQGGRLRPLRAAMPSRASARGDPQPHRLRARPRRPRRQAQSLRRHRRAGDPADPGRPPRGAMGRRHPGPHRQGPRHAGGPARTRRPHRRAPRRPQGRTPSGTRAPSARSPPTRPTPTASAAPSPWPKTGPRLRATPRAERRVAIVLANYPIRDGRLANGVGYDAPQSTVEILKALEEAGYALSSRLTSPLGERSAAHRLG